MSINGYGSGASGGGPTSPGEPAELIELSPFDRHYGLQLEECTNESVRGRVPVAPEVTQPLGMVHGGVYAAIAEALASIGTNRGVADSGMVALGMSNHTIFLRPIEAGHIRGHAKRRHAGRRSWVWQIEMTDDDGRLCASSTMIVAVRQARAHAEPAAEATD